MLVDVSPNTLPVPSLPRSPKGRKSWTQETRWMGIRGLVLESGQHTYVQLSGWTIDFTQIGGAVCPFHLKTVPSHPLYKRHARPSMIPFTSPMETTRIYKIVVACLFTRLATLSRVGSPGEGVVDLLAYDLVRMVEMGFGHEMIMRGSYLHLPRARNIFGQHKE